MKILIAILIFTQALFANFAFGIYYGQSVSPEFLQKFNTIVLDPDSYKNVRSFQNVPYAYISIGEVEKNRDYYKYIESQGILDKVNPNWPDSRYVILKSGKWQKFVLNVLIPMILNKGYNALFLDTIDSLIASKQNSSDIILFINSIKSKYPNIKIIMNRGFEIANDVNVDAILLESTITSVNLETNKTTLRQKPYTPKIIAKKLYSLDYWNMNDKAGLKIIYERALSLGYTPYVADFSLIKIPNILYEDKKLIEVKPY